MSELTTVKIYMGGGPNIVQEHLRMRGYLCNFVCEDQGNFIFETDYPFLGHYIYAGKDEGYYHEQPDGSYLCLRGWHDIQELFLTPAYTGQVVLILNGACAGQLGTYVTPYGNYHRVTTFRGDWVYYSHEIEPYLGTATDVDGVFQYYLQRLEQGAGVQI